MASQSWLSAYRTDGLPELKAYLGMLPARQRARHRI
jgi:hypothetical protein